MNNNIDACLFGYVSLIFFHFDSFFLSLSLILSLFTNIHCCLITWKRFFLAIVWVGIRIVYFWYQPPFGTNFPSFLIRGTNILEGNTLVSRYVNSPSMLIWPRFLILPAFLWAFPGAKCFLAALMKVTSVFVSLLKTFWQSCSIVISW